VRKLKLFTNSFATTFRRCPRECYHRYEQGYSSLHEAESLRMGDGIHLGLKSLLTQGWDIGKALHALGGRPMKDISMAKSRAMLMAYSVRWEPELPKWKVLFVEKEFTAPMINPATGFESRTWQLAGKLDGALEEISTGYQYIIEHKSSSEDVSHGSSYWKKLLLNTQVTQYEVGARALGLNPVGCIYDVLKKPTIKPLQATALENRYKKDGCLKANAREADETMSEYEARALNAYAEDPWKSFNRVVVTTLDDDRSNAARNTWHLANEIRQCQLSGFWMQNPDACERYHQMCQFWDVCTGSASIEDESRFIKEKAHKELELT
jgi:hypothetical protein